MVTVEAVRALGGFEALSDDQLSALISEAAEEVQRDLDALGLSVGESALDRLIALRACVLAARLVRTPQSEGVGRISVTYERLNWEHEYAKALNAERLAAAADKAGVRGAL